MTGNRGHSQVGVSPLFGRTPTPGPERLLAYIDAGRSPAEMDLPPSLHMLMNPTGIFINPTTCA
jgi:hypothetical protein